MSTPQDPRRAPTSADELREVVARKGSFVQTLKAVAWSFLGIRRGAGWQEDISRLNPVHVIVAGLIGAAIDRQKELRFPIDDEGLRRRELADQE